MNYVNLNEKSRCQMLSNDVNLSRKMLHEVLRDVSHDNHTEIFCFCLTVQNFRAFLFILLARLKKRTKRE